MTYVDPLRVEERTDARLTWTAPCPECGCDARWTARFITRTQPLYGSRTDYTIDCGCQEGAAA